MMPRGLGNLQVWCSLNFSSQNFTFFFAYKGGLAVYFRMESESCGFFPTYHDSCAVQES